MDENGTQDEESQDDGGNLTASGSGGFQRRILTEISPQSWEHPADRAALNALRKVPGFDLALRKIFGMFGERAIRLAFKANAVRVSEKQYAWVHERTLRVCEVMDLKEIPEVYVSQTPIVNAGAVGMSDPFIVLNSSMLEVLNHDEVEAVLAHEVGHILSGHVLYRTLLLLIMRLALFRYPIAGLALLPILWALLEWYRKSELSCDRAALLGVQDKDVVMSSLMKLAGGTRGEDLDLQEFIDQSEEYRGGGDLLDSVYKVLNAIGATHPLLRSEAWNRGYVFLPDLYVPCPECEGKRFNRQTLEIRYRDRSIADVLDRAEQEVFQVAERRVGGGLAPIDPLLGPAIERAEELQRLGSEITGIPTGFRDLDSKLAGLHPTNLIVIAGRPGMGKTALALNIAQNVAQNDHPVAIFSLEMSREEIVSRMLCSTGRIDSQRLRTGRLAEADFTKLSNAASALYKKPIFVDDSPANVETAAGFGFVTHLFTTADRLRLWLHERGLLEVP